jgi:hypothetical protein
MNNCKQWLQFIVTRNEDAITFNIYGTAWHNRNRTWLITNVSSINHRFRMSLSAWIIHILRCRKHGNNYILYWKSSIRKKDANLNCSWRSNLFILWLWLLCLSPLVYLLSKTFKLLSFPIFWLWAYPIPCTYFFRYRSCALNSISTFFATLKYNCIRVYQALIKIKSQTKFVASSYSRNFKYE